MGNSYKNSLQKGWNKLWSVEEEQIIRSPAKNERKCFNEVISLVKLMHVSYMKLIKKLNLLLTILFGELQLIWLITFKIMLCNVDAPYNYCFKMILKVLSDLSGLKPVSSLVC